MFYVVIQKKAVMKEHILTPRATASDSNLEQVAMTIDEAGMEILMHNLTNLYSEPELAVLREYTANARDSHVRANTTRSVQVTLPDSQQPSLIVEDFGMGLSKDELKNVYSRYGASTKRDTNTQIGAFGLGAKSALAITDRFDIVSTKDGVTTTAYVQKNVRGVGIFYFTDERPTDAPNGVRITIPVKRVEKLRSDALRWFFLGWRHDDLDLWQDGVRVPFASVHTSAYTALHSRNHVYAWVAKTSETGPARDSNTLHVNLGGVYYRVPVTLYRDEAGPDCGERLSQLLGYQRIILLNLPIGSVEITPSREALIYSEATVRTLDNLIQLASETLFQQAQQDINALDTRREALGRYWEHLTAALPGHANLMWRGEHIPTAVADAKPWYFMEQWGNRRVVRSVNGVSFERLGIFTGHMSKALLDRKAVVVTGLPAASMDDRMEQVRTRLYREFLAAYFPGKQDAAVWFLPDNAQLDPWTSLLVTEEMTYDQFESIVKQYRRDKRAKTGTKQGKAAGDDINFYVVGAKLAQNSSWASHAAYAVRALTPGAIRDLGGQVILYSKEQQFIKHSRPLVLEGGTVDDYADMVRFLRHYHPDATLVVAPTNAGSTTFERRFPGHLRANDVLRADVKQALDNRSAEVQEREAFRAARAVAPRVPAFAKLGQLLDTEGLQRVQDTTTRALLANLARFEAAYNTPAKAETVAEAFTNAFGYLVPDSDTQAEALAESWVEHLYRYILVERNGYQLNSAAATYIEHVVNYINMVDKSMS